VRRDQGRASAARDARLGSAKIAFALSAGGAIADVVFGLSWLGVPAYIAGLAVLFGRPLMAKLRPEPQEPYKPSIRGAFLSGSAECPDAPKVPQKVLERVLVDASEQVQSHHWGEVHPARGMKPSAACLSKDRFRVRVEGQVGDQVEAGSGWERVHIEECEDAPIQIAVWQPCDRPPRKTSYGPVPRDSGHKETYWVEYVGPFTHGACRIAGPFG
jgi:hypothetical protein